MFKRGVTYKRDEIAAIARPEDPPHGGAWTTGYAKIEPDLFIFMNIGVPGCAGHNFENHNGGSTPSTNNQAAQPRSTRHTLPLKWRSQMMVSAEIISCYAAEPCPSYLPCLVS